MVIGSVIIVSIQFVTNAVAPGAVSNPTFDPQSDDVVGGVGIGCDWVGVESKLMGLGGFSDNGCYWLDITCTAGSISQIRNGGACATTGNTGGCQCPTATPW